ncbi:DNA polymerase III subunit delta' [Bacillus sp. UMB0728]|uniref:DNA polymerase III subunit delta' n=1 Tax=Bacillus sp. UMB0728 TaxID=2066052 RepID=UPI000C75E1B3|nr:DNA polymerase III subunit delta' [Bacillus sp. UMB0728]PLR70470.1 DNA polymerase III subunit delta' [Bacillus sp. UMB0728]
MMDILTQQPRVSNLIQKAFLHNKIGHAYLFVGGPEVGKKAMAIWMAKRFFCSSQHEENKPCLNCMECARIDSMNHPDLHFIEPDGQSIKIDQVRALQKEFHYKGVESDKKCYIIEQVDKMTTQAANSLLKFLEEPNGDSLAILLTENKERLLDTILSRVQSYNFQPISHETVRQQLLKIGLDEESSFLLSQIRSNISIDVILEEDWFLKAKEQLYSALVHFIEKPYEGMMAFHLHWPAIFADKDKQQISLSLLQVWFQQVINFGLDREIGLKEQYSLLAAYSNKYGTFKSAEIIEEIIQSKGRLKSNGHYILTLEKIANKLLFI